MVIVVFLVTGIMGASFAQQNIITKEVVRTFEKQKWATDEIIVKFKADVSQGEINLANRSQRCSVLSKSNRGKFMCLRIPKNKTAKEMVDIYKRSPKVAYAEPNFIASALWAPNDPIYSYQWHLYNSEYKGINMESAWDIHKGDSNPKVIVAVLDTGVAYENYGIFKQAPDLAQTSFVAGYDFVNNTTHPNDDEGHGTHVAGTIAQSTHNSLGVAGVAFNASIMPVKVLNKDGLGTYANIAEGIYFATDNGAQVINMSFGSTSESKTLENALAYAYGKGITIVCAAGNQGRTGNDEDDPPVYPAAYNAYCIAVGATRYDEKRSYYSNRGSYIDITAPGGDLYVDQNKDGYGDGVLQQTFGNNMASFAYYFYQGTSMACSHVAGVAALLISHGITGPDTIRLALETTAKDKGPSGWDREYGWGIVDAAAALDYSITPIHDLAISSISVPAQVFQGDIVPIIVNVTNQGDFAESSTVTLVDITDDKMIDEQSVILSSGETEEMVFNWDATDASLGGHTLKAEVCTVSGETNTSNNSMTATVTIQAKPVSLAMHIAKISMRLRKKGSHYRAIADVTIVDQSKNPVAGAMVTGDWVLSDGKIDTNINTASNKTNCSGIARLSSARVKAKSGNTFELTIKNVARDGYWFDSDSNVKSSGSIVVP
ncbi:MAG: S8 family serine peptidase [Candidatus Loosdrechtia sp.]|nr:MAG: S8 family serine peptidase [Candidatus Jettenia sp. AMX2]